MEQSDIHNQILVPLLEARAQADRSDDDLVVHLIDMAIFACREFNDIPKLKHETADIDDGAPIRRRRKKI